MELADLLEDSFVEKLSQVLYGSQQSTLCIRACNEFATQSTKMRNNTTECKDVQETTHWLSLEQFHCRDTSIVYIRSVEVFSFFSQEIIQKYCSTYALLLLTLQDVISALGKDDCS